jgi:hypothetical protein
VQYCGHSSERRSLLHAEDLPRKTNKIIRESGRARFQISNRISAGSWEKSVKDVRSKSGHAEIDDSG